jgi:hypothetical protein
MEGPSAARTAGSGKSINASSCAESSENVPGGEPCRNWLSGIFTAPSRSCSIATRADIENVPPGRDNKSGITASGSRARMSSNGNSIASESGVGAGTAACATGAERGGTGAGARAGGGAGVGGMAAGAWAGGGASGLENNFFKAPNMIRSGLKLPQVEVVRR